MAKDKKSFLLYCDIIHTVSKLSDEQSGILFKHILKYVNDENPVVDNLLIELVFEPIKQQLKRDLKRYEAICERNKNNGEKGGRPKKKPIKPIGLIGNPNNPDEPKKADNDNDNDTDIEIKIFNEFVKFWDLYDKKVGDKTKVKQKWNRLTITDRNKIFETLPNFLSSITDKQFQPFPLTYLNQRRWEDEIPLNGVNSKIASYRFGESKQRTTA